MSCPRHPCPISPRCSQYASQDASPVSGQMPRQPCLDLLLPGWKCTQSRTYTGLVKYWAMNCAASLNCTAIIRSSTIPAFLINSSSLFHTDTMCPHVGKQPDRKYFPDTYEVSPVQDDNAAIPDGLTPTPTSWVTCLGGAVWREIFPWHIRGMFCQRRQCRLF
jgi:hypothetical protein